ncbi:MAG: hypothetical protein ISS72_02825 [Candidatus Brocadiae bacterium]|nr:hypothetical protein [Candidatus Brocadiia bacterium]
MAHVRCSCGQQYNLSDEHLGKRVKCRACGATFTAAAGSATGRRPAARAAGRARGKRRGHKHLGELAVRRGYVSQEQLDACLGYKKALDHIPHNEDRRLGEILVKMSLITHAQLESLLTEQTEELADALAQVAAEIPEARTRKHAVSEERLEAIRESVRAAAKKQESKFVEGYAPERHRTGAIQERSRWFRPAYIAAALGVLALMGLVVWVWPAAKPLRVLAAYLRSCSESAVQPDASLAVRDLGMVVRDFGELQLGTATSHDYAHEIAALVEAKEDATWPELLGEVEMAAEKQKAIALLLSVFPTSIPPKEMATLTITVQPVNGRVVWRQRGAGAFFDAGVTFHMAKAEGRGWRCPWRVAGYERTASASLPRP